MLSDGSDFLQLSDNSPLSMIGYGIVRAIDANRKHLYVTTPLSTSALSSVNVLSKIHGSITPEQWYFQQLSKVGANCIFYHILHSYNS